VARLNEVVEHQVVFLRSGESKILRTLLQRVDLTDTALRLTLDLAPLFEPMGVSGAGSYVFEVAVRIAQCQHGKKLVVQGTSKTNDPDRTLVGALIQAHQWNEVLKEPEITGFNNPVNACLVL
jgi:hypothetical protein